jgi:hypothetical protein
MTRLEFEQNIYVFSLVDHVGEVHVLDLNDLLFISRERSTIGVELSEDAPAASETEKVG